MEKAEKASPTSPFVVAVSFKHLCNIYRSTVRFARTSRRVARHVARRVAASMRVDVDDDIIHAALPSSAQVRARAHRKSRVVTPPTARAEFKRIRCAHTRVSSRTQDLIARRAALLKHRDALVDALSRVSVRAGMASDGRWCDLVDAREADEDARRASTPMRGVYSLSPGAERAAALACIQGATIPMDSFDVAGANAGELDDDASEPTAPTAPRTDVEGQEDDVRRRTIDLASPVFVHDTTPASVHDSGSDARRPWAADGDEGEDASAGRMESKRARVEETPLVASPHASRDDGMDDDRCDGGIDGSDAREGSPGRMLRFSVGGAASDDSAEKRATRAERAATSRRVFSSTFNSGVPKTVILSADCDDDQRYVTLGVVVEFPSDGGASTSQHSSADDADVDAMDVLVFRVGVAGDARGSNKCLGACSVFKSSTAGRRVSRRRSSLTAPVRAPSADAVFVSSSGRFVFAPHVTDGMRIMRVNGMPNGDDSPLSVDDEREQRLECGFRVVRVAARRVANDFLLAAAGEDGQCVVWSWTAALEGDNEEDMFTRAPTETVALPDVLFRNVAPKPGAPTSLAWISAASTPKLVVTLDHALVAVWNVRLKSLERVSYVMEHDVRCVVPIHFEGLPAADGEDAAIPALAIATKKSAPSESYRSTEDWTTVDDTYRDTNVCAALLRSHGVSIGSTIFDDVPDANALASGGDVACVGTRDGTVLAWNVRTGHVALHAILDEYDDAMSPAITRVACHENVVVASCGRRVECFVVDDVNTRSTTQNHATPP